MADYSLYMNSGSKQHNYTAFTSEW